VIAISSDRLSKEEFKMNIEDKSWMTQQKWKRPFPIENLGKVRLG
jgi:hypothetical protein